MSYIKSSLQEIPSDKLFFRIGEVARFVGVQAHVIRFWETEFAAIKPKKSSSRHRMYRRKDVETILTIKDLLYREKYTIAGARQRLNEMESQEAEKLLLDLNAGGRNLARRGLTLVPTSQKDPLLSIQEELEAFLRFLDEDEESQRKQTQT